MTTKAKKKAWVQNCIEHCRGLAERLRNVFRRSAAIDRRQSRDLYTMEKLALDTIAVTVVFVAVISIPVLADIARTWLAGA